ncbi:hypothetical protein KBD08_00860 [Candidatus Babeliales bacterium]|nr:hypothetical protein [Candidatus Babeliales bacterium]
MIGLCLYRFFWGFLEVLKVIVCDPFYIFNISFLWFCVAMAITYGYFLWAHQDMMIRIRHKIALLLCQSLWFGFLCAVAIAGMYEGILQLLCLSECFIVPHQIICHLSMVQQADHHQLFMIVGWGLIILSTLWSCFFIEPLFEGVHDNHIVEGYGWIMIAVSLLSILFLWSIAY